MNTKRRVLFFWILGALLCGIFFCGYRAQPFRNGFSIHSQTSPEPSSQPTSRGPCAFKQDSERSAFTDAVKEKQERDENGYSVEITLTEAVKLFNEELRCYPQWAELPPLTEEEVVASIVAGDDYGTKERWRLQSEVLWKIATERKMPKGSLFVHTDGARVIDYPLGKEHGFVVEANGQRVYLFLGLDKIPSKGGFRMKPEQFFLIRKTMFGLNKSN